MTLVIIGGGPAGYVAAITAARFGREVVLIDQGQLGGTCLNEGCIPTKALLQSADMYEHVKSAVHFGIELPEHEPIIQWDAVQKRKQSVVKQLTDGVRYLMNKNKVSVLNGKASFLSAHELLIESEGKSEIIQAKQIIIASGAAPAALPFAPFDREWIIHSKDAMSLSSIPDSLCIIGGGVIGCEFASIFSRMGTKVVMVERAVHILPEEDRDIAQCLHEQLEETGVDILTSAAVKQLDSSSRKVVVEKNQGERCEIQLDLCLVAIGRTPQLGELNLDQVGIEYDRNGICVNEHMQTNLPHIYACGDVTGGVQLAHAAFHEGTVAASHASGEHVKVNEQVIPRCIYTSPEIASVGLNEESARKQYGDIRIGTCTFSANGKALILNQPAGQVKVTVEPKYQEILGVSIIGPNATELIGQAAVMMHTELTADTLEQFIAAHPTLSEAIHEALLQTIGRAVHC
ncbi:MULTISPECIES: dihydrolipoyl dehydrogenase [unclassified Bacillus (in: firmicutes)]|uniref:dihydrolipoyl dehydrogenase n=1 Tax=unclassified Bacillus (in: firmicutes) TaxID=185979 RepID=UPI000D02AC95|nr:MULTISPECIES: dihydrolipoyl dehydrogenase [unclassified Bacillus (in: firmicutes)]PRR89379.1 dihydrolipoyl dehydrogenase [Bacillus sp. NMCN1]PRR97110.1 dihydrolipoyl dehydrogenase [Bacillus sp. NMCN6]